ncbi:unnamed protein product [Penicillium salamii]|nr:unnamed protein product [Penicillium salamii]CAG8389105.1 unnamed protein product [Penicillium salamii]
MIKGFGQPWRTVPTRFATSLTISCVLLQILFLGNLSYLYGTQFQESSCVHNLNLLYVDYDGGVVGQSVIDAYGLLAADSFPTIQQSRPENFPTLADVRTAVCKGDYWGAVYAFPNGSESLSSAIANGENAPVTLGFVWNGARYAAFMQSAVYSNILTLIQATRSTYYANNASAMSNMLSDQSALQAFLDPIQATEINIKPTNQGSRVLYNSVSMIMPIIMQFFCMMALNGVSSEFNLFTSLGWHANGFIRLLVSIIYTLVSSLCTTGYIWAFKETWDMNSNQFVLTWIVYWLYMHINFLIFDILTTFVPMQYMAFCVLTWMILNVSSALSPFELNPGFYRWGYALPAHEAYQLLGQIWSNGCNNQLHIALPILFSWWVVGIVVVVYATYYRCNTAFALQAKSSTPEIHSLPDEESKTPPGSSDGMLVPDRRGTVESIRIERAVYGPSYPSISQTLRAQ